MLRIPSPEDTPPPLLASVRRVPEGEISADAKSSKRKKRHRGNKGVNSWEKESQAPQRANGARPKSGLLLLAGGLLLAAVTAGAMFTMRTREGSLELPTPIKDAAKPAAAPAGRSEKAILAAAETAARKFLEAENVDELLPLVRNPAQTEARMRKFYPQGRIEAPGLLKFNSTEGFSLQGSLASIAVVTRRQEERLIAFIETPDGLKVDWESWVGWSEIPWAEFLSTKPEEARVFRVKVSPVDYYNFEFSDELNWRSYRLESPDREHSIFGYVPRDSELDLRIRPDGTATGVPMILALKFPAGATSDNQVEIKRFVADGWVEGEAP